MQVLRESVNLTGASPLSQWRGWLEDVGRSNRRDAPLSLRPTCTQSTPRIILSQTTTRQRIRQFGLALETLRCRTANLTLCEQLSSIEKSNPVNQILYLNSSIRLPFSHSQTSMTAPCWSRGNGLNTAVRAVPGIAQNDVCTECIFTRSDNGMDRR